MSLSHSDNYVREQLLLSRQNGYDENYFSHHPIRCKNDLRCFLSVQLPDTTTVTSFPVIIVVCTCPLKANATPVLHQIPLSLLSSLWPSVLHKCFLKACTQDLFNYLKDFWLWMHGQFQSRLKIWMIFMLHLMLPDDMDLP